jgi:hypothetical protein
MRFIGCALLATGAGCAPMSAQDSCSAICDELSQCQVTISGSSVRAGASCETECVALIDAKGNACKSSASYLAECFQTYTCSGIDVSCSTNANEFANDCG